jgi:hypothetical protein
MSRTATPTTGRPACTSGTLWLKPIATGEAPR